MHSVTSTNEITIKNFALLILSLLLLILNTGCIKDEQNIGYEPPNPKITVNGTNVHYLLGSYQWKGAIAGSPTPLEISNDVKPVAAPPSSLLKVEFSYKPEKLQLIAWPSDEKQAYSEPMEGFEAVLPAEKGRYIYALSGVWKEGRGDYVFIIEII